MSLGSIIFLVYAAWVGRFDSPSMVFSAARSSLLLAMRTRMLVPAAPKRPSKNGTGAACSSDGESGMGPGGRSGGGRFDSVGGFATGARPGGKYVGSVGGMEADTKAPTCCWKIADRLRTYKSGCALGAAGAEESGAGGAGWTLRETAWPLLSLLHSEESSEGGTRGDDPQLEREEFVSSLLRAAGISRPSLNQLELETLSGSSSDEELGLPYAFRLSPGLSTYEARNLAARCSRPGAIAARSRQPQLVACKQLQIDQ
eukprot:6180300-Pleurochrysis_carterae.AAC.2